MSYKNPEEIIKVSLKRLLHLYFNDGHGKILLVDENVCIVEEWISNLNNTDREAPLVESYSTSVTVWYDISYDVIKVFHFFWTHQLRYISGTLRNR